MAKKSGSKKKGSSKKSSGQKGAVSEESNEPTRIELVTPASATHARAQAGRIGLGLVLSFPLGWSPLSDAFAGRGAYEISMAKFLLVVAACVTGTTIIGKLLDKAPPALSRAADSGANTIGGYGAGDTSLGGDLAGKSPAAGRTPANNEAMEHLSAPVRG